MTAHNELQAVVPRHAAGINNRFFAAKRCSAHELLSLIVLGQCRMNVLCSRLTRQTAVVQHNGRCHALIVIAQNRDKHRLFLQTADVHHLRQMLMFERRAVNAV